MRLGVAREALRPPLLERRAARAGVPAFVDSPRDLERCVRPAERRASRSHLFGPERRAVRVVGTRLLGRAVRDHGLAANQARLVAHRLRRADRAVDRLDVVPVDVGHDVPAVRLEPPRRVVGEPAAHVAVDRDAVVVVERDQLAELQRPRERAHLVRDALHHAAVAHEDIGVMVDDLVSGTVELRGEQPLGERHADRVGDALAQGARGGLGPRGNSVFRVPGRLRVQLPEALQLLEGQVVAAQMQERVQQHRAVPVREHEAVAVVPARIRRVMAQMAAPQRDGDLRHAHGHSRVARVGGLHRVHGEYADGVGELALGAAALRDVDEVGRRVRRHRRENAGKKGWKDMRSPIIIGESRRLGESGAPGGPFALASNPENPEEQ